MSRLGQTLGNAWLCTGRVAPACHGHVAATATDILGQTQEGDRTSPLAFPVHLVSKLAALTLTGCQLFLPGLRKGGIKGFLWPHRGC